MQVWFGKKYNKNILNVVPYGNDQVTFEYFVDQVANGLIVKAFQIITEHIWSVSVLHVP